MADHEQFADLEIRMTYLEDSVDKLDAVVTRQTAEIDRLVKINGALLKKLGDIEGVLGDDLPDLADEPPPPHY